MSALGVPEEVTEFHDAPEILQTKIQQLAEFIRESRHMICFTGAGVSTSAGIPDFRGPQGVWTLREQGKKASWGPSTPQPTFTHMALVKLIDEGKLAYVVSQNTDGLHYRSGVPATMLSELHGNSNVERCPTCQTEYWRPYRTRIAGGVNDHPTGRLCPKDGAPLQDTIINFGESLPTTHLSRAFHQAAQADLCLVLGSSCRVSPAADIPVQVAKHGGDLVIVNLQRTPLDELCTVRIFAKVDEVISGVLKELGIESLPRRDVLADAPVEHEMQYGFVKRV